MPHEVATFSWGEECEREGDQIADLIEGARPRRAQKRFQFREGELNRIEIGTVGRQKPELRADGFDGAANLRLFVGGEIIEDDDIASPQRWREDLFDIRQESDVVDRPVEHGRRGQPLEPQRGDHGVDLPMTARRVIAKASATPTPSVPADQVGRDAAFIQKDVLVDVQQGQPRAPAPPLSDDVGTALFVRVNGFF